MSETRATLEAATGALFSDLWPQYDDQLFDESVALFERRLHLAGFDPGFFPGKTCLDAGCGGGRNAIAMAALGAARVEGVDLGVQGLEDARRRAGRRGLDNVHFQPASILDLPFADATFDLVWCAGVLMITADEERALDELLRVLKPRGRLYLLVYASEGLRWPLIQLLRPLAEQIGRDGIEKAIADAGLAANKRRTFLDDLFCPVLDFYAWSRLERMLKKRGCNDIERWGVAPRLDHEADLASYALDLEELRRLFGAGQGSLFAAGEKMIRASLDAVAFWQDQVEKGLLSTDVAMTRAIGQGHHRVIAVKG